MHNNNLSPIPFYKTLAEQEFKKWYAYGEHTPLRASRNYLLPFFFYHSGSTSSPSVASVAFYDECGNSVSVSSTYTTAIKNGISTYTNGGGVTFYFAKTSSSMSLPLGYYYMRIGVTVGGTTTYYYSELFRICESTELTRDCVMVKWYDAEDVAISGGGVIPFAHQASGYYFNQMYLLTDVGMPEYSFGMEGCWVNRDGRLRYVHEEDFTSDIIEAQQEASRQRELQQYAKGRMYSGDEYEEPMGHRVNHTDDNGYDASRGMVY